MIQFDMGDVTPFPRPVNWSNLRADEGEAIIRSRAAVTGQVIFTEHTWDRVDWREIPREDVFDILRTGYCDTPMKNEKGDWQVVVTKRMAGHREAGAVTILFEDDEKLIVRTVMWMDL